MDIMEVIDRIETAGLRAINTRDVSGFKATIQWAKDQIMGVGSGEAPEAVLAAEIDFGEDLTDDEVYEEDDED
jgi:fructose-1,6-bisphosphatase/sedoheptulose 1,7-bisphosphatase-like protein